MSGDRSKTRKPREFKITDAERGAAFPVRVIPRASRNEIEGVTGNALKVRVTAPPVEGAANKALIELLAERLKIRKSQIEIVAGQTSRHKMISVVGLQPSEVEERLFGRE
ncbi:MAG: YggU family protein [Anaerolineae bacterium]|nr:YggU family protein [Anaerolineae bacterium]